MVMIIQQDLGAPLLVSAGPTDDMMASAADLLPAVSSASSDSSALAGPGRLERWLNKALGPQVGPFVRTEWCLIGGVVTMVVFQIFGKRWLDVEEHVVSIPRNRNRHHAASSLRDSAVSGLTAVHVGRCPRPSGCSSGCLGPF